ncbi:MAG: DNA starvation/stationary phase protection protein [Porphyromonadaceae bacterium]|jgi:DNA protection during starvation protein 2|nr:DNA starvation/stationary phase protection protein [Porphyromonadaceae bacterium]
MNVLSITGLAPEKAALVAKSLQQLLADFQVYYTNLRGFHWHVRGPQFFTLHAKFEELYNGAANHVDDIAERLLQLGCTPENRFSEYLKVAKIQEKTQVSNPVEIIPAILESLRLLIEQERAVLAAADEAGDIVTTDLISDLLDEQEKSVWMIASLEA